MSRRFQVVDIDDFDWSDWLEPVDDDPIDTSYDVEREEPIWIERPARTEIRQRVVRYGRHEVVKQYRIITNRPEA